MIINNKRRALLSARYRERCKRFNLYAASDLSIKIINNEGFITAKDSYENLLDIRVSEDGTIHINNCHYDLDDLVTNKSHPFDI